MILGVLVISNRKKHNDSMASGSDVTPGPDKKPKDPVTLVTATHLT